MTKQPEALRLADNLEANRCHQAAAELRRLHAENEQLASDLISLFGTGHECEMLKAQVERQAALLREARVAMKNCRATGALDDEAWQLASNSITAITKELT